MTKQPDMTTYQSLPAATGNLINPTVTPTYPPVTPDMPNRHPRPVQQSSTTYPPVTPDLSSNHPRLIRQSSRACTAVIPDLIGDLRTFGLAPGARRSPQNACSDNPATQGLPEHAD